MALGEHDLPFGTSEREAFITLCGWERSQLGGDFQADEGNRTPNLLITNQLLCQLSYVSRKHGIGFNLRSSGTDLN